MKLLILTLCARNQSTNHACSDPHAHATSFPHKYAIMHCIQSSMHMHIQASMHTHAWMAALIEVYVNKAFLLSNIYYINSTNYGMKIMSVPMYIIMVKFFFTGAGPFINTYTYI